MLTSESHCKRFCLEAVHFSLTISYFFRGQLSDPDWFFGSQEVIGTQFADACQACTKVMPRRLRVND
jgi:hypothetical protein